MKESYIQAIILGLLIGGAIILDDFIGPKPKKFVRPKPKLFVPPKLNFFFDQNQKLFRFWSRKFVSFGRNIFLVLVEIFLVLVDFCFSFNFF